MDRLLKPGEASAVLGMHRKTLGRWADSGRFTRIRSPGRHRRYRESEVLAVLASWALPPKHEADDFDEEEPGQTDMISP